jgi:hypothetical protein
MNPDLSRGFDVPPRRFPCGERASRSSGERSDAVEPHLGWIPKSPSALLAMTMGPPTVVLLLVLVSG